MAKSVGRRPGWFLKLFAIVGLFTLTGCKKWESKTDASEEDRYRYAAFGSEINRSPGAASSSLSADSLTSPLLFIGVEGATGNAPESGRVEVYSLEGRNTWTPWQTLQAEAPTRQSRFGGATATVGTDVLIGAFGQDSFAGQVEVFRRGADGYVQVQSLKPSTVSVGDSFGISVAAAADRAAVGAPSSSLIEPSGGVVYCYELTPGGWVETQALIPDDLEANDQFGTGVVMTDTWCFARGFGGTFTGGAVYCYQWDGTEWRFEQKIDVVGEYQAIGFGDSIACVGNVLVIGDPFQDDQGEDAGAAFVYVWDGDSWERERSLFAANAAAGDRFGKSLAFDGTRLVVGADGAEGTVPGSGAAFVYDVVDNWRQLHKLMASDGDAGDEFGAACTLFGDYVGIGAPSKDYPEADDVGGAYVYNLQYAPNNDSADLMLNLFAPPAPTKTRSLDRLHVR